ncbi:MAG: YraN family protein [Eggerthellaceae bacterium]|nr:YraN family protein [Eggerthellaceae bacterium]
MEKTNERKKDSHNKEIGRRGENAAARYLEMFGYEILERNWKCPAGEADIVARDENAVVFVEVKTRTSLARGLPSEAVDEAKRARYEKIAAWYLRDYEFVDVPVRFDVVALLVVSEDRALVRHYRNAFCGGC